MYYMNGVWILGGILMTVFVILVILVIIFAATRGNRGWNMGNWGPGDRRDPLEIAKERYAKGEITREQFEDIKKGLMS